MSHEGNNETAGRTTTRIITAGHRLVRRQQRHQGRGGERAQVLAPLVERAGVGRRRDPEVGRPHIIRVGGSNGHRFCEKEDLEPPLPSESAKWDD
jgi:hypothetical protein